MNRGGGRDKLYVSHIIRFNTVIFKMLWFEKLFKSFIVVVVLVVALVVEVVGAVAAEEELAVAVAHAVSVVVAVDQVAAVLVVVSTTENMILVRSSYELAFLCLYLPFYPLSLTYSQIRLYSILSQNFRKPWKFWW